MNGQLFCCQMKAFFQDETKALLFSECDFTPENTLGGGFRLFPPIMTFSPSFPFTILNVARLEYLASSHELLFPFGPRQRAA